jgi:hypothetical protein
VGHSRPVTGLLYLYLFTVLIWWPGYHSTVTYHGLGSLEIERQWRQDFCAIQSVPKAHTTSCAMGVGSFPGIKGQAHDTDHPSPSRARLQIGWNATLASPMCLHGDVRGDLYLHCFHVSLVIFWSQILSVVHFAAVYRMVTDCHNS